MYLESNLFILPPPPSFYIFPNLSAQLDANLTAAGAINVMWNMHPYMGPHQAGAASKW